MLETAARWSKATLLGLGLLVLPGMPGGQRAIASPWPGPPDSLPQSRLIVTTTGALSDQTGREAAGPPPPSGEDVQQWAGGATERIVEAYRLKGYPLARAWYKVSPDGAIRIFIDEGKVRIGFTGAGSVQGFLIRQSLNLPQSVVHEPTLKAAIEGIRRSYELVNVYYRVRETGEMEITPLGDAVQVRVLQIFVVSREDYGWFFDIGASPVWGVLTGIAYQRKLFWSGDRVRGKIELAFPFRQYLFEENPNFQWVHGGLQLSYQSPRFWHHRLAPRFEESFYVSHLDRGDLLIKSYYRLRSTSLPSLVLFLPPVEVSVGLGADVIRVFSVDLADPSTCATPPCPTPADLHLTDKVSVRVLSRLRVRLEPRSEALRRDQLHFAELRFDFAASGSQSYLVDTEITGQLFYRFGRHRFIVRPHAVLLGGDVRFWDEAQLAGDWQRVWFNNRYWVRDAAQLELAYRINIWRDWIDLGVFHDVSVFADRTRPDHPAAVANAFGPSLHLLLFDIFALDVYPAFGFAPVAGFDHGISFCVSTTF